MCYHFAALAIAWSIKLTDQLFGLGGDGDE